MSTSNISGTAKIEEQTAPRPIFVTDGPCLTSTVARLVAGHHPTKPLQREVVELIRTQALALVEDVVSTYAQNVAEGEVGRGGSAKASVAPVASPPTGLLYGRIQSGKTNAMILAAAAAIDNGFRTVVVLTSDNLELVKQTAQRFRVLDSGPLVYSSTGGQWLEEVVNIRRQLAPHGVVFVCSKNKDQLPNLFQVLTEIGAADFPALIFDDEADQATPDTTVQARALGRSNAPADPSTTFRRVVQNTAQDEQGESIREVLRHNVFVQVTATPYALLLQNTDSPLRPMFTRLLDPGDGYNGGEDFFSDRHLDDELAPLVYVSPTDSTLSGTGQWAPEGLSRAIAFFLVSTCALELMKRRAEPEGYKFLCHTSAQRLDHDRFTDVIRSHVNALLNGNGVLARAQESNFAWAHASLSATRPDVPSWDVLMDHLRGRLHQRRFLTINSDRGPGEYGSAFNFLIGGNILGRGLTIDNLLVTYYMRMPKTTQMDTMLQHARMFGYRGELMPFTRVFLPSVLAARFAQITASETALRDLLAVQDPQSPIPVHIIGGLRPTRANVLNPNAIGGIRSGEQVYPRVPAYELETMGNSRERIEQKILEIAGVPSWRDAMDSYIDCPIEDLVKLVETVRTGDPGAGDWDPEALSNVLRSIAPQYGGRGCLFVRTFTTPRRKQPILSTGAIGGEDQDRARAQNRPVLFMLWHDGARPFSGEPFWYPTLVFPTTMANQVFNVT